MWHTVSRFIGIILTGVLLANLYSACGVKLEQPTESLDSVNFALDWIPSGRHAGYYTALDKGYYRDVNIDVKIARGYGSADSVKRVASGAAQFAVGDMGSLVLARANDMTPVKVVAMIYSEAPYILFFSKDTGITVPKDWEGKTIAAPAGDATRVLFPAFAKLNNFDSAKVNWLTIDPTAKLQTLFGRKADGTTEYLMAVPLYQKQASEFGFSLGTMKYADWGMDVYSNGIMVNESTMKDNPDLVRRFVAATLRGLDYAFQHPAESAQIVKKYVPETDVDIARQEVEIVRDSAWSNEAKTNGLGYMDSNRVKSTRDLLTQAFGLKVEVNTADLYTNDFLPKQ